MGPSPFRILALALAVLLVFAALVWLSDTFEPQTPAESPRDAVPLPAY
jgi:hypothetical protein